jgi:hypothetical protein
MKNVILSMLLFPLIAFSQTNDGYGVLVNEIISPNPMHLQEFEDGLAAHNKKFHNQEMYGARTYEIFNGKNTGKYVVVMGPMTWSAADEMPEQSKEHDSDWYSKVMSKSNPGTERTFWRAHPEQGNIPGDFTLNKLFIDTYALKRGKGESVKEQVSNVQKVMTDKYPDLPYMVYTNEMPNSVEGNDLAVVYFFDNWSWMGEDPKFKESYEEVHGSGSFDTFLKDWEENITGKQSEVWIYRPDLSGVGGEIKVATRQ